jgi:hypothetical protein
MHAALGLFGLPAWAVALVFAALAPFFARAWGRWVERRVRGQSIRALASLAARPYGSIKDAGRPTEHVPEAGRERERDRGARDHEDCDPRGDTA